MIHLNPWFEGETHFLCPDNVVIGDRISDLVAKFEIFKLIKKKVALILKSCLVESGKHAVKHQSDANGQIQD